MANRYRILLTLFLIGLFTVCHAGSPRYDAPRPTIKHPKCKLKGKWLLVNTVMENKSHPIDSAEYKGFFTFKPLHRFQEEAFYEGYHWIITGKWNVNKRNRQLTITNRKYVLGKLEDKPVNALYKLESLTKTNWSAYTEDKNVQVLVSYKKLGRK